MKTTRRNDQNVRRQRPLSGRRRGAVLYVVLVIVALLTLAAYQFSEVMLTENKAANLYGRRSQARASADSGVEVALSILGNRQLLTQENVEASNLYYNDVFRAQLVQGTNGGAPAQRGRYSVVTPVENDETGRILRFGLGDESGKLNLNVLTKVTGNDEEGQDRALNILMQIPGMTQEIGDAILDWIDPDDEERLYGAEEATYGYAPKNAPLESLDELLLIPDVTPQLVFGFDWNRNGLIDPQEATEATASSTDLTLHPLGWSAFLTVHSKEANLRIDGSERIYVNNGVLADLYDQIVEELAEDGDAETWATFIVAYRMNGPVATEDGAEQQAGQGLASGDGVSAAGSSGQSGGATLNPQAVQQLATGTAQSLFRATANEGQAVTRGGMNLAAGAQFPINSLYDLVDVEVRVEIDGATKTLQSPWTLDNIQTDMPILMDRLSTVQGKFIEGRVNVNQARREVLIGVISAVDGFSEDGDITLAQDLAQKIIDAKLIEASGTPVNGSIAARNSTAWLVTDSLVTLPQMRQLDRYLTTRGDVFRAQVIGYFDQGGPVSRLETIIDATKHPPRVILLRDLSDLGKGFTPPQLGAPEE